MSRIWLVVFCLLYLVGCNREQEMRHEEARERTVVQENQTDVKPARNASQRSRYGSAERPSTATAAGRTTDSAEAQHTTATVKAAEVSLRGRVQNGGGGPIPQAKLTLFENVTSGAKTAIPLGDDGRFKAAVEMQKNYTLKAEANGYAPAISDNITVTTATAEDNYNLVMHRGRSVSGIVIDAGGNPVPAARVTATIANDGAFSMVVHDQDLSNSIRTIAEVQSGGDGKFILQKLPVDKVLELTAEEDAFAHAEYYRLNAENNDTSGIQLQLPATGTVTGAVYDQAGAPLTGATVTVMVGVLPTKWSDKAETIQDGSFVINRAPTSATAMVIASKSTYDRHIANNTAIDRPLSITLHRNEPSTVTVTCLDAVTLERVTSVSLRVHNTSDIGAEPEVHKVEPGLYEVESRINADMFIIGESEGYDAALTELKPKLAQENVQLLFARPSRISGRVIDAISRKPVKGAKIYVRRQAVEGGTTGEDGRFEFMAKMEHNAYFAVAPDERFSKDFKPVFAAGKVVDVGDIEVAGNAGITVMVQKGDGQEPVRGAKVLVRNASSGTKEVLQQGITNYDGKYDFDVEPRTRIRIELPEWSASVEVNHEPQAKRREVKLVVGGASIEGEIVSDGKPRAGTVSGRHMGIANAQFSNVRAASDGKFEVKNLLPGRWELSANIEGGLNRGREQVEVLPNKPVKVTIDVAPTNRKIKGTVVDDGGNPVPGIRVAIEATNANGGVKADDRGRFETWQLEPGKCELQAVGDKLGRSQVVTVQVPDDDAEIPEVELVVKRGSGRVACTILSLLDGLPIDGGAIVLQENGRAIATGMAPIGRAGDAVIENILTGDYTLMVTAPGYERKTRPLRVEDKSDIHLDEVLAPAANVRVDVKNSDGNLANGVSVTLIPLEQDSMQSARTATTDARGMAAFGPVPYGSYQVEAIGAAGTGAATISTVAQREVTADVVLKAAE